MVLEGDNTLGGVVANQVAVSTPLITSQRADFQEAATNGAAKEEKDELFFPG